MFTRLFDHYADTLEFSNDSFTLEVGCETGAIARSPVNKPNFRGHIIGVHQSPAFVNVASALADDAGIADQAKFRVGDAHNLDSGDGKFDLVIAHRAISHVVDPQSVVNECDRVLCPRGLLFVFDGDYSSLTYGFPDDPELGRRMDRTLAETTFHNPLIMRALIRLLSERILCHREYSCRSRFRNWRGQPLQIFCRYLSTDGGKRQHDRHQRGGTLDQWSSQTDCQTTVFSLHATTTPTCHGVYVSMRQCIRIRYASSRPYVYYSAWWFDEKITVTGRSGFIRTHRHHASFLSWPVDDGAQWSPGPLDGLTGPSARPNSVNGLQTPNHDDLSVIPVVNVGTTATDPRDDGQLSQYGFTNGHSSDSFLFAYLDTVIKNASGSSHGKPAITLKTDRTGYNQNASSLLGNKDVPSRSTRHSRQLTKEPVPFCFMTASVSTYLRAKSCALLEVRTTTCEVFDYTVTRLTQNKPCTAISLRRNTPPIPLEDEKSGSTV